MREHGFRLIMCGILAVLMGRGAVLSAETELLGDGNDGNRTPYVHLIDLLDENGVKIRAADQDPNPFSPRTTCGQCHNYKSISLGWHFAGPDPNVPRGRPSQPWVLRDAKTRTQIPISSRGWKGAFTPEQMGMTAWEYINQYGSHLPGGGYGETEADAERHPEEMIRQQISGKFEINCMTCHSGDRRQDSNTAALQAARQNFQWIATASSGLATVNGTASALSDFFDPEFDEGIKVAYHEGVFNEEDQVYLDIRTGIPAERCYFCHSNQDLSVPGEHEWTRDRDVHLKSGLTCADCHRHGQDHRISRGFETDDPLKAGYTCEGCHLGTEPSPMRDTGRLGAPEPVHWGIPTIHFEKLTCTACHTGPWPQEEAGPWRTARMHKLGLHGKHALDLRLPHVYGPVMMKGEDGKIGPYRLLWPAYWGLMEGDTVTPLPPEQVLKAAESVLSANAEKVNDWLPLTEEQIVAVLQKLASEDAEQHAVYICGGRLYFYDLENGKLVSEVHPAAEPYAWAMAHDVRPAGQSLGVKRCEDCHTTDSPFFFGKVPVDGPIAGQDRFVEMVELQGIHRFTAWAFNFSFVFRPWLKAIALAACGLIGLVLLAYALKAVGVISKKAMEDRR